MAGGKWERKMKESDTRSVNGGNWSERSNGINGSGSGYVWYGYTTSEDDGAYSS